MYFYPGISSNSDRHSIATISGEDRGKTGRSLPLKGFESRFPFSGMGRELCGSVAAFPERFCDAASINASFRKEPLPEFLLWISRINGHPEYFIPVILHRRFYSNYKYSVYPSLKSKLFYVIIHNLCINMSFYEKNAEV